MMQGHTNKLIWNVLHQESRTGKTRKFFLCVTQNMNEITKESTGHKMLWQRKGNNTGWGKITSLNFKVNNKKTIRDTKILFLDSETTTWEVLNHIVLKRISCKWWPLLSINCCRRILIFRITLSSMSCGMRATSRRIASFSACTVLGQFLNTSAFRYPHKK